MLSQRYIQLKPIGFVRIQGKENEIHRSKVSELVINPNFVEALNGLKDFSHLFVIFWMHKISQKGWRRFKVHPRGRRDLPLVGAFATRTPHRPNPIGLTLVELLSVEGNTIMVRGLDAFDSTPILDIKPFDNWDSVNNVRVPAWWISLEKERVARQ